jgi:hypothetical protein
MRLREKRLKAFLETMFRQRVTILDHFNKIYFNNIYFTRDEINYFMTVKTDQ